MVLGTIDTGKTTVVCYLANYFFNLGKTVAVIDLDMGQQDIGPPSTITVGILEQPILKLSDIPLSRLAFIGKTSPVGRMVQALSAVRSYGGNCIIGNGSCFDIRRLSRAISAEAMYFYYESVLDGGGGFLP